MTYNLYTSILVELPLFSSDLMTDDLCTQGYHIINNFLAVEHAQNLHSIAENLHHNGAFHHAKIGRTLDRHQNTTIRSDEICWLDHFQDNPSVQNYLQIMNEMLQTLNQSLFLSLSEFETHFAIYQPGSFYKKHVDQFQTTKNRKISCVYYLNENWQPSFGGALKLYSPQDQLLQELAPLGNTFICFNSELPHEVELTHQVRYSIAGWMKTRATSSVQVTL